MRGRKIRGRLAGLKVLLALATTNIFAANTNDFMVLGFDANYSLHLETKAADWRLPLLEHSA